MIATLPFLSACVVLAAAAAPAGQLRVDPNATTAGGLPAWRIETPAAVYVLEKTGAGLAGLIDRDGNDWLSFDPAPGSRAGGEFRGFPNAVHQQGGNYFHPRNSGTDPAATTLEHAGPDRVTIAAVSEGGLWACRYDFFPTHCTFTMTRMPPEKRYWVLYEGTPGGRCDDGDWWLTSDAAAPRPLADRREGDIPPPEWIAFGDARLARTLFLLHHEDDTHPDAFYLMDGQMTVFGFGRSRTNKYLDRVPQSFSIGFLETKDHLEVKDAMKTMLQLVSQGLLAAAAVSSAVAADPSWVRKSSTTGDLPVPNEGKQQTCCVVADFDKDGVADFAVGERTAAPSVVWYKFNGAGWDRRVIDDQPLRLEAGGAACDVDGDGDQDLILGQDASGSAIWWWENPHPDFSRPWTRRLIKDSGGRKHHDQTVADFDGDGKPELLSWNQKAEQLLLFKIPPRPRDAGPWKPAVIYSWDSGQELEGFPSVPTDVDGDGLVDIVGGGRWFQHQGGTKFAANVIDDEMRFTQCAAGQLVEGGWAEIVFSPGDTDGVAKWYEWKDGRWVAHSLRHVIHGHTCEIGDVDGDGHLDIMIGEMGNPGAGDQAQTFLWYGDGQGNFRETVVSVGQGIHEGQLGDFNGDGRLDILMKPYSHNTPRIDVLVNTPPAQ